MSNIHIFKPSGEWYDSGVVDMTKFSGELIHIALFKACESAYESNSGWPLASSPRNLFERDDGWSIVCIDPEHPYAHPIMLKSIPSEA